MRHPSLEAPNSFGDVSIIVPALNEAAHVEAVLKSLRSSYPEAELLLVDNGSTDGTAELAQQVNGVTVLRASRRGKGFAMQTGANAATRNLLLFHDADLEYTAADGHALVAAVRHDPSCMATGVRTASFGAPPWSSLFANAVIQALLARRFGSSALAGADILCGTRVLARSTYCRLGVKAGDFRIETELTRKALTAGIRLVNIPVQYCPRTQQQGKKIRPLDILGLMREAIRAEAFRG